MTLSQAFVLLAAYIFTPVICLFNMLLLIKAFLSSVPLLCQVVSHYYLPHMHSVRMLLAWSLFVPLFSSCSVSVCVDVSFYLCVHKQ